MKQMQKTNQRWTLKSTLPLAAMVVAMIGMSIPAMAKPPLPSEPRPKPSLTAPLHPSSPKPSIHVGAQPTIDPLGALPDLKILQVKPHLHFQASQACKTGRSPYGRLVGFDLLVKNVGKGVADLRNYDFDVDSVSVDGKSPAMFGGDGYSGARRTPASVAPGQTFRVTGSSGVWGGYYGHPVTFPVSRYSELAGKTRRFKVELRTGGKVAHELHESNYNNNSKTVSYTFPLNFCQKSTLHGGVSQPVGPSRVIKPAITRLQFASGKSCVAPAGVVTIIGSGFGNAANGRHIELGGHGIGIKHIPVESWSDTRIRVHLPRDTRIRYNKNYWLAINSATDTHQSNLQLGIRLCPPTVHVGSPVGQNGNTATGSGLPDLEISRLVIRRPSPNCFNLGTNSGVPKYYTLPTLDATITLHNKGSVQYTTHDSTHNRELPIGVIGDKFVGPPDGNNVSLCMVPTAPMAFSHLVIPAGGTKTVQTKLRLTKCINRGHKVVGEKLMTEPFVRELLGTSRSVNIGVGKAVFISRKIPAESNYDNNFRRAQFTFPSRTCGGR